MLIRVNRTRRTQLKGKMIRREGARVLARCEEQEEEEEEEEGEEKE